MAGHPALERTSPKGQPFIGYCRSCGKQGLTPKDIDEECPNPKGFTKETALIDAIENKKD